MKRLHTRHALSILLLALYCVLGGGSVDTTESPRSSSRSGVSTPFPRARPPVSVSAKKLASEYKANEIAADQKYKDRVASISGTVESIGKDILATPYVVLTGAGFFPAVQCFFSDADQGTLARLRKGQSITIRGRIDGEMGNVLVKECSVR